MILKFSFSVGFLNADLSRAICEKYSLPLINPTQWIKLSSFKPFIFDPTLLKQAPIVVLRFEDVDLVHPVQFKTWFKNLISKWIADDQAPIPNPSTRKP